MKAESPSIPTRAGYFYYVMEPADDAVTGAEIQPATYLPKTLSRVLKDRGRLPLQELLPIALSRTDALDHLHRHQLVHRDIKPSNIIWHLGVPKLADIGLVTATGDGSTLVGTRGYFPDGGVVDASGDLFALGKVLYQAATGLEPALFPRFPDNLPTDTARQELRELNEILFRACASDPEKRYRTASEMRRDLAALDAGQSLWQQRRRRQMAIGAALLTLVTIVGVTFARRSESRLTENPNQLPANRQPAGLRSIPEAPMNQRWTNSLGQMFVPVPMSSDSKEAVHFSIWDTRVHDYQVFVMESGRS